MKTRVIGAGVALVLAVIGTVGVLSYVAGADERAFAGTKTVEVLVVTKEIPKGTPAQEMSNSVSRELVPAKVVSDERVSDLKDLTGKVAAIDLKVDEQVLSSRFTDPRSLVGEDGDVEVPKGMQELTVQLDPLRVLGGQIKPGDKVGVFISWTDKDDNSYTHLVFEKVLVTKVQGASAPASSEGPSEDGKAEGSDPAPEGSVLVTLARNAPDAERVVWASEFGKIWLSKQPEDASPKGTRVWTQKEIYR